MSRRTRGGERRGSRWVVPVTGAVLGGAMFAASWIGGHPWAGAEMLGVLLAYGALLLLGGRNDILAMLGGRARDERWRLFDLRATSWAGVAVLLGAMIGAIHELALGRSGMPYTLLLAVGGLAYLAAVLAQSLGG